MNKTREEQRPDKRHYLHRDHDQGCELVGRYKILVMVSLINRSVCALWDPSMGTDAFTKAVCLHAATALSNQIKPKDSTG